eukprot:m.783561 g.783561  ORF g.783561 m.783561 type:complete len:83 (-) comp59153_c0_seq35:25-273(-)
MIDFGCVLSRRLHLLSCPRPTAWISSSAAARKSISSISSISSITSSQQPTRRAKQKEKEGTNCDFSDYGFHSKDRQDILGKQ